MFPELLTAIPGPKSLELARQLREVECRNITYCSPDFPVFWKKASGAHVWDVDGNRFLDLTSGFGVCGLGYGPPSVVEAAQAQLGELYHAMGDVHPAEIKVRLCQKLSELTFESWGMGQGKTILTNSGTEAIEAALKTALITTGRPGVLAFEGAYHGLGYGALTVGGLQEFRSPFGLQLAEFATFLPFPECGSAGTTLRCADCPNPESVKNSPDGNCEGAYETLLRGKLAQAKIGAILVEPIQGRAGVRVPPRWFLPLLRRLASESGALLILDEIYTGFYRTGARFACELSGVVPDLICLGKALTGGFPLAACVGKSSVMDQWPASDGEALHTSTFLGNPLGCRIAVAALEELERNGEGFEIHARGVRWRQSLERLGRGTVRGVGYLVGWELADATEAAHCVIQGLKRGLILLSGGVKRNVLTMTPPFIIRESELDWATDQLDSILREIG